MWKLGLHVPILLIVEILFLLLVPAPPATHVRQPHAVEDVLPFRGLLLAWARAVRPGLGMWMRDHRKLALVETP